MTNPDSALKAEAKARLLSATPEQSERASAAVAANMNASTGRPLWDSAMGYACALTAIVLSDARTPALTNPEVEKMVERECRECLGTGVGELLDHRITPCEACHGEGVLTFTETSAGLLDQCKAQAAEIARPHTPALTSDEMVVKLAGAITEELDALDEEIRDGMSAGFTKDEFRKYAPERIARTVLAAITETNDD